MLVIFLVVSAYEIIRLPIKIDLQEDPIKAFELSRYFYSIPFYWVMLGISSLKVIAAIMTSLWLCHDTKKMRKWLSYAMMLNWVSSGLCVIFGLLALTLL